MAAWGKWTAIVGGVLAVVGGFVPTQLWLAWVGGVLAVVGGFGSK